MYIFLIQKQNRAQKRQTVLQKKINLTQSPNQIYLGLFREIAYWDWNFILPCLHTSTVKWQTGILLNTQNLYTVQDVNNTDLTTNQSKRTHESTNQKNPTCNPWSCCTQLKHERKGRGTETGREQCYLKWHQGWWQKAAESEREEQSVPWKDYKKDLMVSFYLYTFIIYTRSNARQG